MSIFTVSNPAAPRLVTDSATQFHQNLVLSFKLNNWFASLMQPANSLPKQETQEERDATVAKVEIKSDTQNRILGAEIPLVAVAYDGRDIPVSGVTFEWSAEDVEGVAQEIVDSVFTPKNTGLYTIRAIGANNQTSVKVDIIDPSIAYAGDNSAEARNQRLLPQYDEWHGANIASARTLKNIRGNSPGKPKGKNNFNITAPVLSIPGRGLNLDLALNYNSLVWSKVDQDISYDMDKDFLAPGWTLGFGKIVNMIAGGITQFDADGTRRFYSGELASPGSKVVFMGQSTDGSFIKAKTETSYVAGCYGIATTILKYPDGTTVHYSMYSDPNLCYAAGDPITMVPTRIQDKNGNQINITYHTQYNNSNPGKWINTITDTLNRTYLFNYTLDNGRHLLTSISGPSLPDVNNQSAARTFVRLGYRNHTITHNFSGLTPHIRENTVKVLSAIYYPSTQSGYWFGDTNAGSPSYSPYGMIRKVQEQKGMGFTETGGITSSQQTTRERIYSYPVTTSSAITDIPTFSTVTESWEGMTSAAPTTTYEVNWDATPRTTTIISADNSKVVETSYNYSSLPDTDPEKAKDGITYKTEYFGSDLQLKAKDEVEWELGYQVTSSANSTILRPKKFIQSEIENGITLTKITENSFGPEYNQVTQTKEIGYGGTSDVLRTNKTEFTKLNDISIDPAAFINGDAWRALPRLINLPIKAEVFEGATTNRIGYTKYEYDVNPLQSLSGNPGNFCVDSYCSAITARGNLSKTKVYDDAATLDVSGEHSDNLVYDKAGNVIEYSPETSGTTKNTYKYTLDTRYGYPEESVTGSPANSNLSVKSTATYNLNTGLTSSMVDADLQPVTFERNPDNWRLTKTTLPTGAYSIYDYDDETRTYSKTAYSAGNVMSGKQLQRINGLGQTYRQQSYVTTQSVNGQSQEVWDTVEFEFDKFGRSTKSSNPFRSTSDNDHATDWTEVFYDTYGRSWKTVSPDGSTKYVYYNESTRPAGAASDPGKTTRIKDPIGREKWSRADSDGNLVEVIEPNPDGTGAVASNGLSTKYSYDRLGQLTKTEQGLQQRHFRYDSLGRLTRQKMAEAQATLDDTGAFVGTSTGLWSDFYTYDKFSNIVSYTDARGVTTSSSYVNPSTQQIDPLNRLFSVSYNTNGAADVLPSPTVNYSYQTTSNVSQLKSVSVTGVSTIDMDYDTRGRIKEKKTTLVTRPDNSMIVNYFYDSLNRVTDIVYPNQYVQGSMTGVRKNLHYDFDTAGRTTGLKVDNDYYASDFVFNNFNQVTSVKIGPGGANQITENYNYNPQTGLLENQKVLRGATSLLDLSYQYQQCSCSTGGSGQVKQIVNNLDRNKDRKYDYDAVGRLKKVTGGTNEGWSQTYTYDRYGNRKTVNALGFENLRQQEGDQSDKTIGGEQKKILSETLPLTGPNAKELLSNVKKLTTLEEINGAQQNPAALYKETENANTGDNGNLKNIAQDNPKDTPKLSSEDSTSFNPTVQKPFDFDGDGKADYSVFQRGTGNWAVNKSVNNQTISTQFGASTDQIAPADYDGDGKTDIAVFRPSTNSWYILKSSDNTYYGVAWGQAGDAIAPADYDGDGKADIAVWHPGNSYWYILRSSDNNYTQTYFGGQQFGDIPAVGDYDGDGKADVAVWRPGNGTFYILKSSNGQVISSQLGGNGYVPVPADYDGDGKTDAAVWSLSTGYWYITPSTTNQIYYVQFGGQQFGDVLVPADYDGDGKADIAVWRAQDNGMWYVRQSSNGAVVNYQLGAGGNLPVPAAYIRRSSAPNNQSTNVPRDGMANITYDETSNRITTTGFAYDFAGNQTSKIGDDGIVLHFQYDAAGRMVKVKDSNLQTMVTYTYGASRERLITQEGNTNSTLKTYYAWEGGAVISEYVDSIDNKLVWTKNYILMSGALLATQEKTPNGESVQFNHPDKLGTRVVTNPSDGTSFEQNTLPFGTALESESTGKINRRFTSYDRSRSTGLDYATNRFYDSSQGRFTQVDPITMDAVRLGNPQTLNLYAYTANDPVNKTDPSGLDPDNVRYTLGSYWWWMTGLGSGNGGGNSINMAWTNFFQGIFELFTNNRPRMMVTAMFSNPSAVLSMADRYGLPNSGEKKAVTPLIDEPTPCELQLPKIFGDKDDLTFVDVSDGDESDPINKPGQTITNDGSGSQTHNHMYNPLDNPLRPSKVYAPAGGKIIDYGKVGVQTFINIYYENFGSQKDVVLQIWHVEKFNGKGTIQKDGRILLGEMDSVGRLPNGDGTNGVIDYYKKSGGKRFDGSHIHINAFKKWWKGKYVRGKTKSTLSPSLRKGQNVSLSELCS